MMQMKQQVKAICKPSWQRPKHHRKDSQDNVGKILVAAGPGSNLHRLLERGYQPKEGRATRDWRMSP